MKQTKTFILALASVSKRRLMSFLALTLCTVMYAQQEITGTVTDAMGPVIGATVMEKGTSNGTVTDFDGNFKLKVQAGKTLVFSYIGYKSQELPAKDGMQVSMEENAKELAEVVVTGYTTQRKADLTGAVAVVQTKDLKTSSDTDPMRALQGKVPGMTITSDGSPVGAGTVRIRGIGSFNSSQDPLFIIGVEGRCFGLYLRFACRQRCDCHHHPFRKEGRQGEGGLLG